MWRDRPAARRPEDLASGPGKACAALGITGADDGMDLGGGQPVAISPRIRARQPRWRCRADREWGSASPGRDPGGSGSLGTHTSRGPEGAPLVRRPIGPRRAWCDVTGALLAVGDPALAPTADLRVAVSQVEQVADRPSPGARRLLRFVADHPDAAARTCATGHLTASAFVVDPSRSPGRPAVPREAPALAPAGRSRRRGCEPGGGRAARGDRRDRYRRAPGAGTGDPCRRPPGCATGRAPARPLRRALPGRDAGSTGRRRANHESTDHRWIAAEDDLAVLGADPGLIELARVWPSTRPAVE